MTSQSGEKMIIRKLSLNMRGARSILRERSEIVETLKARSNKTAQHMSMKASENPKPHHFEIIF